MSEISANVKAVIVNLVFNSSWSPPGGYCAPQPSWAPEISLIFHLLLEELPFEYFQDAG